MPDTIFALSSGPLPSGVAVIRISGPDASLVCEALAGSPPPPRAAELRSLRDPGSGELIDKALVLFFATPHSFTGEDILELQVHGSRAVIAKLLDILASRATCRPAQPGEFARRAFLNGKLDLTSAEGLADLIDARTETQRRQSIAQAGGALARQAAIWRQELLDLSASLAAVLDFADEADIDSALTDDIVERCRYLAEDFQRVIEDAKRGEIIRDGFTVVLAGPPNAGKSSLLNAIARRDVAIVSPYAGTTRDMIEVTLDLKGIAVVIVDTAGVRDTSDPVERLGIERTVARAQKADLVIWLTETGDSPPNSFDPSIRLRSKADLGSSLDGVLSVSAATGSGLDELLNLIERTAAARAGSEPALVTHGRQKSELIRARDALNRVFIGEGLELVADDIRSCVLALDTLVGAVDVETVLGSIFARFCIGK